MFAQARRDGPVAQSTLSAIGTLGYKAAAVRTMRKYWFSPVSEEVLNRLCTKLLANDAIEQAIVGGLPWKSSNSVQLMNFKLFNGTDP